MKLLYVILIIVVLLSFIGCDGKDYYWFIVSFEINIFIAYGIFNWLFGDDDKKEVKVESVNKSTQLEDMWVALIILEIIVLLLSIIFAGFKIFIWNFDYSWMYFVPLSSVALFNILMIIHVIVNHESIKESAEKELAFVLLVFIVTLIGFLVSLYYSAVFLSVAFALHCVNSLIIFISGLNGEEKEEQKIVEVEEVEKVDWRTLLNDLRVNVKLNLSSETQDKMLDLYNSANLAEERINSRKENKYLEKDFYQYLQVLIDYLRELSETGEEYIESQKKVMEDSIKSITKKIEKIGNDALKIEQLESKEAEAILNNLTSGSIEA